MENFQLKKIIIRMPNWVGDLVMSTPVLKDIREKFPKAFITALCKDPLCHLLKHDENIDKVLCFNHPDNLFLMLFDHKFPYP